MHGLEELINRLEGAYSELKGLESMNNSLFNKNFEENIQSIRKALVEIRDILSEIILNNNVFHSKLNDLSVKMNMSAIELFKLIYDSYTKTEESLKQLLGVDNFLSVISDINIRSALTRDYLTKFMQNFNELFKLLKYIVESNSLI